MHKYPARSGPTSRSERIGDADEGTTRRGRDSVATIDAASRALWMTEHCGPPPSWSRPRSPTLTLAGPGKHFQGRTQEIQRRSAGGVQPGVVSGCGSGSVGNQSGGLLVVG